MLPSYKCSLFCVILLLYSPISCISDPVPYLTLLTPGVAEYMEIIVKRVHDNLTLYCELKGEQAPRSYVWNFIPANGTSGERMFTVTPKGDSLSSNLTKLDLQESDSGKYMCSAPPFSLTKYIIVQEKGPSHCARGAFWCGSRCVLPDYVCDGRADCVYAEDEHHSFCPTDVCQLSSRLNCSAGRCIPEASCCRAPAPLCRQPACCDEHPRYSRLEAMEVEFPPLYEDRHASDDYGFIQSTIYTVTACALIFMIAVVLLVSAICKMHMKRAALRTYTNADRATRRHYTLQLQGHRFPPCYETSRLLQECAQPAPADPQSPESPPSPETPQVAAAVPESQGFGLASLSNMFSTRYTQVPTQSTDVEMTSVRASSLNNSPTRDRTLDNVRSPTFCDLDTEFYFTNSEAGECGRDLNYMATPVEFFRRRAMRRNTLERVMDQIDRQRLTLQLGRFQLTLPSFGRRSSNDRRPDTPNVAEINIDDLDFVRLNSNDTYTLNGRTIRLLGANFENYPVLPDGSVRPPPYTEAMRYKLYGPPPEYLSREGLNRRVDEEARTNVEMPPCYDDLAAGNANNNNGNVAANNEDNAQNTNVADNCNVIINNDYDQSNTDSNIASENNVCTNASLNAVIDNLPAIDSDVNANDSINVTNNDPINNVVENVNVMIN